MVPEPRTARGAPGARPESHRQLTLGLAAIMAITLLSPLLFDVLGRA